MVGSSLARPLVAVAIGALVAACVAITGIDEIGVCEGGECNDAAASEATTNDSIAPVNGGDDAKVDQISDAGDAATPDSEAGCATCDGGTCCSPNVCRSDGTCRACGTSNNSNLKCYANTDCCATSAQNKCNENNNCVSACGGADASCPYVPGSPGTPCCIGFTCEQALFLARCRAN